MILRFWKTEWKVPVLPKIYSGNICAQREQLEPGQKRNSAGSAGGAESWLRRRIFFHAAHPNVLTWPLGLHLTHALKSLGIPAKGEPWTWALTEGQGWADPWWSLQSCGELGSCSFISCMGWRGDSREVNPPRPLSELPCWESLPSKQINLPVGQSHLVLCPFAEQVTSYWWSISHKDITTPKITGQSTLLFSSLILFYPKSDIGFLCVLFQNVDLNFFQAVLQLTMPPCMVSVHSRCHHKAISHKKTKLLATNNQLN